MMLMLIKYKCKHGSQTPEVLHASYTRLPPLTYIQTIVFEAKTNCLLAYTIGSRKHRNKTSIAHHIKEMHKKSKSSA
jgi:hypothetical protein